MWHLIGRTSVLPPLVRQHWARSGGVRNHHFVIRRQMHVHYVTCVCQLCMLKHWYKITCTDYACKMQSIQVTRTCWGGQVKVSDPTIFTTSRENRSFLLNVSVDVVLLMNLVNNHVAKLAELHCIETSLQAFVLEHHEPVIIWQAITFVPSVVQQFWEVWYRE